MLWVELGADCGNTLCRHIAILTNGWIGGQESFSLYFNAYLKSSIEKHSDPDIFLARHILR